MTSPYPAPFYGEPGSAVIEAHAHWLDPDIGLDPDASGGHLHATAIGPWGQSIRAGDAITLHTRGVLHRSAATIVQAFVRVDAVTSEVATIDSETLNVTGSKTGTEVKEITFRVFTSGWRPGWRSVRVGYSAVLTTGHRMVATVIGWVHILGPGGSDGHGLWLGLTGIPEWQSSTASAWHPMPEAGSVTEPQKYQIVRLVPIPRRPFVRGEELRFWCWAQAGGDDQIVQLDTTHGVPGSAKFPVTGIHPGSTIHQGLTQGGRWVGPFRIKTANLDAGIHHIQVITRRKNGVVEVGADGVDSTNRLAVVNRMVFEVVP